MFQNIDFEKMSYDEGLAVVAAQHPLEKQALNFADVKTSVGDVLSNPYTQYGLVGAGLGGLGGLASTLFKNKNRKNYLRDMLTGATIGGLGGLAVRGGQDALSGLSDYTSAADAVVENKIEKDYDDPGMGQKFKNLLAASGERFKADIGFASPITPGGPNAESSAEYAKRTDSSAMSPGVPVGAGAVGFGVKHVFDKLRYTSKIRTDLIDYFIDRGMRSSVAERLVDHARGQGFIPKGLGPSRWLPGKFGNLKNFRLWLAGRRSQIYTPPDLPTFRGGRGTTVTPSNMLLPDGTVPKPKIDIAYAPGGPPIQPPDSAFGWKKLVRKVTQTPAAKTIPEMGSKFFRSGAKRLPTAAATLLPMLAAYIMQTSASGYSSDLSKSQLSTIIDKR